MPYNPTLHFIFDERTIEPAPMITITKEPIYIGADENVIGYTYTINLDGYASSNLHSDPATAQASTSLHRLQDIKNILHRNGKTLRIHDNCNNKPYITAYGSKLVDFNVQEGEWINYIKYTASIEFNELIIHGDTTDSTGIAGESVSVQDPVMAQMMLKLKSYDDTWNFTIPESEAYMYYARAAYVDSVNGGAVAYSAEDYTQIQVTYTINATGKHFYNQFNTTQAAWEAAKDFVQYKLYNQIAMFRQAGPYSETPFSNNNYNSYEPNANSMNQAVTSNAIYQNVPVIPPILDRTIIDNYAIYNETIDCSTSETAGTFSATYTCVLKRFDMTVGAPKDSVHTFSMSYDQARSFRTINRTLTLNGRLQGMIRTNILENFNDGQRFILPMTGRFYQVANDNNNKYANAYRDFVTYIATNLVDDIQDGFKFNLGINYANLFPGSNPQLPCVENMGYQFLYQVLAKPKNFTVNHSYSDGVIEYAATYDTERACAQSRGYQSLTITEEDSLPKYAEHTIVGRHSIYDPATLQYTQRSGFLQNLNTNSPKKLTISFQGVTNRKCTIRNPFSLTPLEYNKYLLDPQYSGLSANVCDTDLYVTAPTVPNAVFFATELAAYNAGTPLITTSYTKDFSVVDGSYTIAKTYLVTPPPPLTDLCP